MLISAPALNCSINGTGFNRIEHTPVGCVTVRLERLEVLMQADILMAMAVVAHLANCCLTKMIFRSEFHRIERKFASDAYAYPWGSTRLKRFEGVTVTIIF